MSTISRLAVSGPHHSCGPSIRVLSRKSKTEVWPRSPSCDVSLLCRVGAQGVKLDGGTFFIILLMTQFARRSTIGDKPKFTQLVPASQSAVNTAIVLQFWNRFEHENIVSHAWISWTADLYTATVFTVPTTTCASESVESHQCCWWGQSSPSVPNTKLDTCSMSTRVVLHSFPQNVTTDLQVKLRVIVRNLTMDGACEQFNVHGPWHLYTIASHALPLSTMVWWANFDFQFLPLLDSWISCSWVG